MIKLDNNTILDFEKRGVKKIKIFFYDAGCSGNKVDIIEDFDIDDELVFLSFLKGVPEEGGGGIKIYIEKHEKEKFTNSSITRVIKADHTGKQKVRYIFSSEDVKDRCSCGTSFGFEKKVPKIDLNKLKNLRNNFKSK